MDEIDIFLNAEEARTGETLRQALERRGLDLVRGLDSLPFTSSLVLVLGDADWCLSERQLLPQVSRHYLIGVVPYSQIARIPDLLLAGFEDVVCGPERAYEIWARLQLGRGRLRARTAGGEESRASGGFEALAESSDACMVPAQERFTAVSTLAAGVAHEINNPLTYIRGNLDFALQILLPGETQHIDEDVVEGLREAREGTVRVADIVSSLKTFSRIEEEDDGPCSLPRAIAVALRLTRNEIRHCADLKVTGLDSLPRVKGSKSRIAQIFVNLLLNAAQAIEARPAGRGRITMTGTVLDEMAVVEVSDDGVGIPSKQQRRIFDPFYSTRPLGLGTGLGLPVAENLVRGSGGRLELESELDQGTTLRVLLPVAGAITPATWSTAPESLATDSLAILVVDDERPVLSALRRMLVGAHRVTIAGSVAEATEQLHSVRFDVILCDLLMPEGGGQDVYGRALEINPGYARRFVFMTGGAFRDADVDFLRGYGGPTLRKPIEPDQLAGMLAKMTLPGVRP